MRVVGEHRHAQKRGALAVFKRIGRMLHHQPRPLRLHGGQRPRRVMEHRHEAHVHHVKAPDGRRLFHGGHQIHVQQRLFVPRQVRQPGGAKQRALALPHQPQALMVPADQPRLVPHGPHGGHLPVELDFEVIALFQRVAHQKQHRRHSHTPFRHGSRPSSRPR